MANKDLRVMSKMELLNVMKEQELDIEKLTAEAQKLTIIKNDQNDQIERLTEEVERLRAMEPEQNIVVDSGETERLATELAAMTADRNELARRLEDRRISMESAGSLAEAAVLVSGIIQAAQDAANVYLENVRFLEMEKMTTAAKMEDGAKEKAAAIIAEAEEKAAAIVRAAELKKDELENIGRKVSDDMMSVSRQYMDFIDKTHLAMRDMISKHNLANPSQTQINTGGDESWQPAPNIINEMPRWADNSGE